MQRLQRKKIDSQLIGLGLLIVILIIPTVVAYNPISVQATNQFNQIEQPFLLKLAVTLSGLALICFLLWWCRPSQNRRHN